MKTIEIDSDIYVYILQNTSEIGESASSILRRLLGLSQKNIPKSDDMALDGSALNGLLASPDFMYAHGVVGRFLAVLKWLHDRDPEGFAKVENIRGRGRIYFAKDIRILEEAGRSVNPKRIPNTQYYVITTTPTPLKQEILKQAMRLMNYSIIEIRRATEAIAQ